MVELLVASYNLDYSNCVSKSFRDIEYDVENGQTIAMIHLNAGTLPASTSGSMMAQRAAAEVTEEEMINELDEDNDVLLEDDAE